MGVQSSEVWNWEMYCNRYWYKRYVWRQLMRTECYRENITYMWLFSQLILLTPMLFSTCLLDIGGDFHCTLYNFLNCKIVLLLFCMSRHICQSSFEEILHWPACMVIQEFREWFSWLEWYITGIKGEDILYRKFPLITFGFWNVMHFSVSRYSSACLCTHLWKDKKLVSTI